MKRCIVVIALCLAAGAIANVLVTAFCALRVQPSTVQGFTDRMERATSHTWPWPVPTGWPDHVEVRERQAGFGVRHDHAVSWIEHVTTSKTWSDHPTSTYETFRTTRQQAGWPCKVVTAEQFEEPIERIPSPAIYLPWSSSTDLSKRSIWENGLPLDEKWSYPFDRTTQLRKQSLGGQVLFPLRPIPWAIALNTLFYAMLIWVLCFAPSRIRRIRRRRRGACAECGYDLKGLAPNATCPECGTQFVAVPSAA